MSKLNSDEAAESLRAMIARPAMYFGERSGYLREISAFDFGFEFASGFHQETIRPRRTFLPIEFVDFICTTIPEPLDGSPAWVSRIEHATEDERSAWNLFLDLWQAFEKITKTQTPNKSRVASGDNATS
jgi:hypothetical protein